MPKPILKMPQKSQTENHSLLDAKCKKDNRPQERQMDKLKLDRLLRKKRSKEYLQALHQLDAGGHVCNQERVNEIIDTIRQEFPEVKIEGVLLGIVSICYLGKPYEVHSLNVGGQIIEHFEAGRALPNGMEKARGIALRGGYEFIEVYVDCCRAISADGTVSVIDG